MFKGDLSHNVPNNIYFISFIHQCHVDVCEHNLSERMHVGSTYNNTRTSVVCFSSTRCRYIYVWTNWLCSNILVLSCLFTLLPYYPMSLNMSSNHISPIVHPLISPFEEMSNVIALSKLRLLALADESQKEKYSTDGVMHGTETYTCFVYLFHLLFVFR